MRSVVSIIIPLYNRVDLVTETLASLIAQTYPYWEAIVVDDGSTDESYETAINISNKDSRIKVYKRERLPTGASVCRNIGLEYATGEYVICLDSDDLLAPYCLEQRVAIIHTLSSVDFVVFNMLLFEEGLTDTNLLWNKDSNESDLARFLRTDGVWSITGPIHRKVALERLGGFDETIPFWQDVELHIRAICKGANYIKKLNERPDCYNRRHQLASISQQGFNTIEKQRAKIEIYKKLVVYAEKYHCLNEQVRTSIVSYLFACARQLIVNHQELTEAVEIWQYASQKGQVNKGIYIVGKLHLISLSQYQLQNKKNRVYLFSAKLLSFLLPKRYKLIPMTIGQVKY